MLSFSRTGGALLLSLGLVACEGRFTGGGVTASTAGGSATAAYGFQLAAIDADGDGRLFEFGPFGPTADPDDVFRGTFTFNDMAAGVAFQGTIDLGGTFGELPFNACMVPCNQPRQYQVSNSGVFVGTYEPIPKTLGPGGYFEVLIVDNGEPGVTDPQDEIFVWVGSGVHAGYSNLVDRFVFQKILGGNIQFHPL